MSKAINKLIFCIGLSLLIFSGCVTTQTRHQNAPILYTGSFTLPEGYTDQHESIGKKFIIFPANSKNMRYHGFKFNDSVLSEEPKYNKLEWLTGQIIGYKPPKDSPYLNSHYYLVKIDLLNWVLFVRGNSCHPVHTRILYNTLPKGFTDQHELVGKNFIFLPQADFLRSSSNFDFRYHPDDDLTDPRPSYKDLEGKTGQIRGYRPSRSEYSKDACDYALSVNGIDGILFIHRTSVAPEHIPNIGYLSEMSEAKQLIGKYIWKKDDALFPEGLKCEKIIHEFERVKIVNVEWNWSEDNPLIFHFRTDDGTLGTWTGKLFKSDNSYSFLSRIFSDKWYLKKPSVSTPKKYKSIWQAANEGSVYIGMATYKALMILGSPEDKNVTVGSWGKHEQWVYDSGYLYFENGKLVSYQH